MRIGIISRNFPTALLPLAAARPAAQDGAHRGGGEAVSEIPRMELEALKILARADRAVSTAYVSGVLPRRHSTYAGRTDRAAPYLRALRGKGLIEGLERRGAMRATLWRVTPAGHDALGAVR